MKILWFEVTVPLGYSNENRVIAGWQDSLESIVKDKDDIELYIAFRSIHEKSVVKKDNIEYHPMPISNSFLKKQLRSFSWKYEAKELLPQIIKLVDVVKPDLIHVFGCEWPYGLIAKYTKIPVVIHIQGSIVPYHNALLPPKYSNYTVYRNLFPDIVAICRRWRDFIKNQTRLKMEREIWQVVSNYMGRTDWDFALSKIMHRGSRYFHVEEAIRTPFLISKKKWECPFSDNRILLVSVGVSSFWKGPDMMVKTAKVLREMKINFCWKVAGSLPKDIKKIVEYEEKTTFEDNNIELIGFKNPDELIDLLCSSTFLVHTAYIENSPNSICEAQCLGVPVISTNVGGISTLVRPGIDGLLVPANDPWQMAYSIVSLAKDNKRMIEMSKATREHALQRHKKDNILFDLLNCYKTLIDEADK